jgi:D-alanyl-D-alanine carboxypeptidase
VFGTSFALKKDTLIWQGASGNLTIDQPYFIASTTKLFTTAIILKLRAEGKLSLDDKIGNYIDTINFIRTAHLFKEKDYSQELTIKHYFLIHQDFLTIFKAKEQVEKVWKMK